MACSEPIQVAWLWRFVNRVDGNLKKPEKGDMASLVEVVETATISRNKFESEVLKIIGSMTVSYRKKYLDPFYSYKTNGMVMQCLFIN